MSFVLYYNTQNQTRYPNPTAVERDGYLLTDDHIVELNLDQPEFDNRLEVCTDTHTEQQDAAGNWFVVWDVQPRTNEEIYDNLSAEYLRAIEVEESKPYDHGNGLVVRTDDKAVHLLQSLIATKQSNIPLELVEPIAVQGALPEDVNALIEVRNGVLAKLQHWGAKRESLKTYLVASNIAAIKSTSVTDWVQQ